MQNNNNIDFSLITKITSFISEIGIECKQGKLPESTFLPGIDIQNGSIIYDPDFLKYPGDLLHEAGHLAVLLPQHRLHAQSPDNLFGNVDPAAAEMSAIAWSWAAREFLQLSPEVLFHEQGYKGNSPTFIENFSAGNYFGVPLLQWFGMTKEPKKDVAPDQYTFPQIRHWLRQAPDAPEGDDLM